MKPIEIHQRVDITEGNPIPLTNKSPLFSTGDNAGNEWIVHVARKGQPVDLAGGYAEAYFKRQDGELVHVDGMIDGSTVKVAFSNAVYNVPGQVEAYMRYSDGTNAVGTIAQLYFTVQNDMDAPIVDDGTIPPINQIVEEAKEATDNANAAADRANQSADSADTATEEANNAGTSANAAADEAREAAEHPPIPSDNNTWMVWNANTQTYVDTGLPSIGPKGDPGEDLIILNSYTTLEELEAAHPTGEPGQYYSVGPDESGRSHIYGWSETGSWKDFGVVGTEDRLINGKGPDSDGYHLEASDIPAVASDGSDSNVQAELDELDLTASDLQGQVDDLDATSVALQEQVDETVDKIGSLTAADIKTSDGSNVQVALDNKADFLPTWAYYGKELPFTWAQIKAKIQAGDFSGIRVGDFKTVPLTTGEIVIMEVAGINTYINYGNTGTGYHIDWISRDCLATAQVYNATATNSGGYVGSALKTLLNGTIYNTLPAELKAVISQKRGLVETKTAATASGWSWQDLGFLWLPSEREVWGQDTWSEHTWGAGLAVQYEIFKNSLRHIVKELGNGGGRVTWWVLSSVAGSASDFCYVSSDGAPHYTSAAAARGVPLCFRISA